MDFLWACLSIYISQFLPKIFNMSFLYTLLYPFGVINKFSNDDKNVPEIDYLNYYITNNCWCMYKKPVHVSEASFYKGIDEHKNIPQFALIVDSGLFYKSFTKDFRKINIIGYCNVHEGHLVGTSANNYYKKREYYIFGRTEEDTLDFINMIRDEYIKLQKQRGLVYKFSICPGGSWPWWSGRIFPAAKLDSFTMSDEMSRFKDDLELFAKSRKLYGDKSRPYKMSSLIYGPPGTGKSRFIKSLAYHFDIPILDVNLATGKIDDEGIKFLLKLSGTGLRILLLDEFDTIKHQMRNKSLTGTDDKKEAMKDLSKAGWNNLLDCEAYDSLIVVCITNLNIPQLRQLYDDSFLRDGRFDNKYLFGNATTKMIGDYLVSQDIDIVDTELFNKLDNKYPLVTYRTIIEKHISEDKIYNALKELEVNSTSFSTINNEVSKLLSDNGMGEYIEVFNKRRIIKIGQLLLCSEAHLKGDFNIPLGDTLLIMSIINRVTETIKNEKEFLK